MTELLPMHDNHALPANDKSIEASQLHAGLWDKTSTGRPDNLQANPGPPDNMPGKDISASVTPSNLKYFNPPVSRIGPSQIHFPDLTLAASTEAGAYPISADQLLPSDHIISAIGTCTGEEIASHPSAPGHGTDSTSKTPEERAQEKLDSINLDKKAALPREAQEKLRAFEQAILNGDTDSVEKLMHEINKSPDDARPMMDVLTRDLYDAGIRPKYSVGSVKGDDPNAPPERTGILHLDTRHWVPHAGMSYGMEVSFYTNPKLATSAQIDTPQSVTSKGQSTEVDALTGLVYVRNQMTKFMDLN